MIARKKKKQILFYINFSKTQLQKLKKLASLFQVVICFFLITRVHSQQQVLAGTKLQTILLLQMHPWIYPNCDSGPLMQQHFQENYLE